MKWDPNSNRQFNNACHSQVKINILTHFIAERGKAASLLKPSSKRKRTRSEIEEVKEEEKQLKENRQGFLKEAKRLK